MEAELFPSIYGPFLLVHSSRNVHTIKTAAAVFKWCIKVKIDKKKKTEVHFFLWTATICITENHKDASTTKYNIKSIININMFCFLFCLYYTFILSSCFQVFKVLQSWKLDACIAPHDPIIPISNVDSTVHKTFHFRFSFLSEKLLNSCTSFQTYTSELSSHSRRKGKS